MAARLSGIVTGIAVCRLCIGFEACLAAIGGDDRYELQVAAELPTGMRIEGFQSLALLLTLQLRVLGSYDERTVLPGLFKKISQGALGVGLPRKGYP